VEITSTYVAGPVTSVRRAVLRALLEEIDRLLAKEDWSAADAVTGQLIAELDGLSATFPGPIPARCVATTSRVATARRTRVSDL
jgi:hypothetical protein